jgi:hypothetical protein
VADTLTDFIVKPSAPLAAGVILFGVVWGCFKGVESVLTDDTKLEIAVWLVGVKPLGPRMEPWPETFIKQFDRIFGDRHLTIRCFSISVLASVGVYGITLGLALALAQHPAYMLYLNVYYRQYTLSSIAVLGGLLVFTVVADYVSFIKTRLLLSVIFNFRKPIILLVDILLTLCIASALSILWSTAFLLFLGGGVRLAFGRSMVEFLNKPFTLLFHSSMALKGHLMVPPNIRIPAYFTLHSSLVSTYPAFFTSVWLWLYAGSGFLLKFAHRFDIGFQWFNSKVDIEKKPLSAIGLVAGALVAVLWWTVVVVKWIV